MGDLDSFLTARKKKGKKGSKTKTKKVLTTLNDDKSIKKDIKSPLVTLSGAIGGEWADSDSDAEKPKQKKTTLVRSIGDLSAKKSQKDLKEEAKIKNLQKPERERKTWKSAEEVAEEAARKLAQKQKEDEEEAKKEPVVQEPSRYVYRPGRSSFSSSMRPSPSGTQTLQSLNSAEYFPSLGASLSKDVTSTKTDAKKKKKSKKSVTVPKLDSNAALVASEEERQETETIKPVKSLQLYVAPETDARTTMLERCWKLKEERKEFQLEVQSALA